MTQKPEIDTIVDEIHQSRRRISEKFGGNIAAILDDARKRQSASGRPIWQRRESTEVIPPLKTAG
jgi:hypothetical protein